MTLKVGELEIILEKSQENFVMPLEKFFKIMNMETGNLGISSPQPSAESLIHQIGEFRYEPEASQTFFIWFGNLYFPKRSHPYQR